MTITAPNDFAANIYDRIIPVLLRRQFAPRPGREAGAECLKSAPNDCPQCCPVSERDNSFGADADVPTLIEPVEA
jgi:putative SOS response-associated peptidase YedK